MAKRNVAWTETAQLQRRAILIYWVKKNKSTVYAVKLVSLIKERIDLIQKNPFTFQETEFKSTRVSAMGHFSIFYKVYPRKIIITAFWDNRQDPKKLLAIIKK
jgi:plasmid stabilization system protein ParE